MLYWPGIERGLLAKTTILLVRLQRRLVILSVDIYFFLIPWYNAFIIFNLCPPSRGSGIYQYYILLTGIQNLKIKETDKMINLLVELRKLICTLNVSSIRYWHIVSGYTTHDMIIVYLFLNSNPLYF